MTYHRNRRGRVAAFLLLPATALLIGSATGSAGAETTPKPSASLSTGKGTVRLNERVAVRGRFRPLPAAAVPDRGEPAAQVVRIQFRARGSEHWRHVRSTRAGRAGRFAKRLRFQRSGRIRALSADGRATGAASIRVRSVTRARVEKRARLGRRVAIRGRVAPAGPRRRVSVKVGRERLHARTNRRGRFELSWKPRRAGHTTVRVRAAGNAIAAGSTARAGRVAVFRPAEASYYGPGLYGNGVACGGRLKPSTVGVAHKSLPCGTRLTIRYHGRQVKAKVIDRGPYVAGREFDLTEATKHRLGFGGVGTILVDR